MLVLPALGLLLAASNHVCARPPPFRKARILMTNDDDRHTVNNTALYYALVKRGHDVIMANPVDQNYGPPPMTDIDWRGDYEQLFRPRNFPCEFGWCVANGSDYFKDPQNPRIVYDNTTPRGAVDFGLRNLSMEVWGSKPELVISGINVGSNVGLIDRLASHTIDAAAHAAREKIPAIVFTVVYPEPKVRIVGHKDKPRHGIDKVTGKPVVHNMHTYVDLAVQAVDEVLKGGLPYMPHETYLDIALSHSGPTQCSLAGEFRWVLSRMSRWHIGVSFHSIHRCGHHHSPIRWKFMYDQHCYASVSVGESDAKVDSGMQKQQWVLEHFPYIKCPY